MNPPEYIQRFRVEGVLGEGGMGTVYRAFDPELQRAVAIKVLGAGGPQVAVLDEQQTLDLRASGARSHEELLAEARIMAAISHPNVLPIFEVGRFGERVFLVMELIEGVDLRRWLAEQPRTTAEIVAVLVDSARGLAAAHHRGIVHRDFKPDNVLVGSDGRARVADFGVSSLYAAPASMLRVDDAPGTPAYMAPEIWQGSVATPASDVYAFAKTAVEALVGELPGDDDRDRLGSALDARGVAPRIRDALVASLSADPAARPADGNSLVGVLQIAPAPRSKRWPWLAAACTLALGGGAAAFAIATDETPSCELEPNRHAAVWSARHAARARSALSGMPAKELDELIAKLDDRIAKEGELRVGTCRDRANKKIGMREHDIVLGCLERRTIELDARITRGLEIAATKPERARELLGGTPAMDECAKQTGHPLAGSNRVKLRSLYDQYFASVDLSLDERRSRLEQILPQAVELGDLELAANIGRLLAKALSADPDRSKPRSAYERARDHARQIGSPNTELRVLAEHIDFERTIGELVIARVLAQEAAALLAREPAVATAQRALTAIAKVAHERGDTEEARDYFRRAFAEAEKRGHAETKATLDLRMSVVQAELALDRRPEDHAKIRDFAEQTLQLAERLLPADDSDRRRAIFLAGQANTAAGNRERGKELDAKAFAMLRASKPSPGMSPLQHAAQLASETFVRGHHLDGIEEMRAVIAAIDRAGAKDLGGAALRDRLVVGLGMMLFAVGEGAESRLLIEEGLLELTGKVGGSHKRTRDTLGLLLSIDLDLRDLERASRRLDAFERAVHAASPVDDLEVAGITVSRAALARLRGQLEDADRLSKQALTSLDELEATPKQRRAASLERARVLAALGRHADAIPFFHAARADIETRLGPNMMSDFELARAERAAGHRSEADARAAKLLEELAPLPGYAKQRAEIEAWLKQP